MFTGIFLQWETHWNVCFLLLCAQFYIHTGSDFVDFYLDGLLLKKKKNKQTNNDRSSVSTSNLNLFVHVSQIDLHFMKKIPPGAEASNVLVGELEFLDRPVVAFVRLAPAVLLNGLAEVPITTR